MNHVFDVFLRWKPLCHRDGKSLALPQKAERRIINELPVPNFPASELGENVSLPGLSWNRKSKITLAVYRAETDRQKYRQNFVDGELRIASQIEDS